MKLFKVFSRKPRIKKTYGMYPQKKDPVIPAVSGVHLDFDKNFIRECLRKRKMKDFEKLSWPEAIKKMYEKFEQAENRLLHIESCCKKAREENILPIKNLLSDLL